MSFWQAFFQYIVGPVVTLIVGAWLNRKINNNDAKTDKVDEKADLAIEGIKEVHNVVNSRLSELVLAEKASAHAAGLEQGRGELAAVTDKAEFAKGKLKGQQEGG